MILVQLTQIVKSYSSSMAEWDEQILKGVDLSVNRGEFLAIVGPSGSGKSTLLNIIGLMDRPSSGALTLFGSDLSSASESRLDEIRREKMGFIFQTFNLLGGLTARENIELNLLGRQWTASEARDRANATLAKVEMMEHADKFPYQLSGGQKQRIAIARAFVHQPDLIIADEPTASLDQSNAVMVTDILVEMRRLYSTTIVMASHDERVFARADRILKVQEGRIDHA